MADQDMPTDYGCPEFPYFGAPYPDARCCDGFLWDLDSDNGEGLFDNGGEVPCPFCNEEGFIQYHLEQEDYGNPDIDRMRLQEKIKRWKERYTTKYATR